MFIINITYKTALDKVDLFLEQHIEYLNNQYELGNFLASGKKNPRTGGVILSNVKDPFKIKGLANYDLIEFVPSKTCHELKFLIEE